MSENPRLPGHPSDGFSSRQEDARIQQSVPPPVNVYNQAPPPSSSGGNNHLRNLIIGALITAAGSISVYYATVYMNRSKGTENNIADMKVTTRNAWKSFVAYENTYTKNLLSFENNFSQNGNFDEYLGGLRTESSKFSKDLGDILPSKNLDPDLVKALNRRLENERVSLGKAEAYINNLKGLIGNKKLSARETTEKMVQEQLNWNREYKGMFERAVNDIREIANTLSDRYGETFSMDELLVVQIMPKRMKTNDSLIAILENSLVDSSGQLIRRADPEGYDFVNSIRKKDITGYWNANGNAISFKEDGKMTWVLPDGGKASGTWTIDGNMIIADMFIERNRRKVNWHFKLSRLSENACTLTNADPPNDMYHLARIQVN